MTQERSLRGLLRLDPRTKLFMIFTVSLIVLMPATTTFTWVLRTVITLIPLGLLIVEERYAAALRFAILYAIALLLLKFVLSSESTGFLTAALLGYCGIVVQFIPSIITAWYAVITTEIDEFMSALNRMHCPLGLSISLAVLIRFFPTIREEYSAISNAMKMRGIALGGGNISKIIEYRMIPLLFSCVSIGEELSAAAITRGLGSPVRRTSVCDIRIGAGDILIIAVLTICAGVFIAAKYF